VKNRQPFGEDALRYPKILVIALCVPVLLGACSARIPEDGFTALPPGAHDAGQLSVNVIVVSPSSMPYIAVFEELYSQVNPAYRHDYIGTSPGGAVGALAVAAMGGIRDDKASKALAPLLESIGDFDVDRTVRQDLDRSLSKISWLHAAPVQTTADPQILTANALKATGPEDATLYVFPDYRFSNEGGQLLVQWLVRLVPNSPRLAALRKGAVDTGRFAAPGNAIYGNLFAFWAAVPEVDDRDKNIAEWSADHGAQMRAVVLRATDEFSALLAEDLQRPPDGPRDESGDMTVAFKNNEIRLVAGNGVAELDTNGIVVKRDSDGLLIRNYDGSLSYVMSSFGTKLVHVH
jgi:hypothetical protein